MLQIAFERLGLTEVVALVSPSNVASRRVVEKVGGSSSATLCMPDYPTCFIEYGVECVCAFEWKPKQTVRRFTP